MKAVVAPSRDKLKRLRRDSGVLKRMKGRLDYQKENCVAGHLNYIEMWLEELITAIVHGLPEGMDNESAEQLIDSLTHTLTDKIRGAYENGRRQMLKQIRASGNPSLEQTSNPMTARPKCSGTREKSGQQIEVGGCMYDMTAFHSDELRAMGDLD